MNQRESADAATEIERIVPKADELTKGFWEAAQNATLAVQRCNDCGYRQHPPERLCSKCGGVALSYTPVSGDATLWSWIVTQRNLSPAYEAELPYICVAVELVEQLGLLFISDQFGLGVDVSQLKVGLPMRVIFDAHAGDVCLPRFMVVSGLDGGSDETQ